MDYNPQEPLISIHIPKAGGSAFAEILKLWFRRNLHLHYYNEVKNKLPKQLNFSKLKPNTCIHGHFNKVRGFGIEQYYPSCKQFITILRDPLEIQISKFNYRMMLHKKNLLYYQGLKESQNITDIDEYLESTEPNILLHFPKELTMENYREILDSHFVHLGILENLSTTIEIISEKLNQTPIIPDKINVTSTKVVPSKSIATKFKDKYKLEYAIYEYAKSINS